ncbi:MAG: HAD hydrolase-like protein [Nanoarchaeota archaeon]|nr:HAD hydrolase-like protein [Nanoarchaeota archaeon]
MIKAIVFDIGGVLIEESGKEARATLSETFGIDQNEFSKFAIEKLPLSYKGLNPKDFFKELIEKLKLNFKPEDLIKSWRESRIETSFLNSEIFDIIKKLKEKYFLVSLTNSTMLNDTVEVRKISYLLFNLNIISYEVGFMKPEKEIYKLLIKKMREKDISPQEVVFIDDKIEIKLMNCTRHLNGAD